MTDFLASMSIWTGAVLAVLTVLDWALTNRQKNWLTDRAIALFVWLDDQRELKYLKYLGKFKWQRFVIIIYAVLAGLGALLMAGVVAVVIYTGGLEDFAQNQFLYGLLGLYLGSFFTALCMVRFVPRLLNWVTKTEGSLGYIGRSTLTLLTTLVVWVISDYIEGYLVFGHSPGYLALIFNRSSSVPASDEEGLLEFIPSSNPILNLLYGLYAGFWGIFMLGILISWMLVVIPVVLILLLMLVLRGMQFVTARIAENPKGPILGVSGLLTAIGALAKIFL
jgi:hypothetical protein